MTNNKKYYPWIVVALLWGVALLNYLSSTYKCNFLGADNKQ